MGVTWQAAFAELCGAQLSASSHVLLFASLWLVYMADHLLDARQTETVRTVRHRFALRHGVLLWRLWGVVALLSVTLAVLTLNLRSWFLGAAVLILTACYFWLVHHFRSSDTASNGRCWFVKEIWVSGIYCAGVSLFVLAECGISLSLVTGQVGFSVMVLTNLLVISDGEHDVDTLQHEKSLRRYRSGSKTTLTGAVASYAALCWLTAWLLSAQLMSGFFSALGLSATLTLALRLQRKRRLPEASHALFDLALLAPLLRQF